MGVKHGQRAARRRPAAVPFPVVPAAGPGREARR